MSDEELLSQEEIDALLHGVDKGEVDTETESKPAATPGEVSGYDLTNQDQIVRGRLPTLEMINERFVRYAQQSMFNFLRQTIEVSASGVENVKYSEYLQTLSMPSSINTIKINPLRGKALVVIDSGMVFMLVDRFFGGGAEESSISEREFTATELRIVDKILQFTFADLKEAWQVVMAVDFERIANETNPQMATSISTGEVVVLSSFEFKFDEYVGKLQVAIPYSMIEPVREVLDAGVQVDTDEGEDQWGDILRESIKHVNVPLGCKVVERKIKLREILNFKAGDIIPIEMPNTSVAYANGVEVFNAHLGTSSDHLALKVVDQMVGRNAGHTGGQGPHAAKPRG